MNFMGSIFPLLFAGSSNGGHDSGAKGLLGTLYHHILDSKPLIELSLFGIDISITKHVIILWIVTLILIAIVLSVAKAVKKDKSATGSRLSILVQIFLDFIDNDVVKPNFHDDSRKWLPYFTTLFFFILLCNLFGLIPESATITGNLAVTFTLAVITFLLTQIYGMSKQGFFHYWVSIVPSGVPKVLWPLMFVIEIVGLVTKPFALTIRLFANMIAGHIVILVLLSLAVDQAKDYLLIVVAPLAVLASVAISLLEILIALLQAYIFTFLSAIFIASAGEGH